MTPLLCNVPHDKITSLLWNGESMKFTDGINLNAIDKI